MKKSFLAHLYEVQEELLHYPGVGVSVSKMLKLFTLKFLFDGQGADRQAILSGVRSCLKRGLLLKERICSIRSKFFSLRFDLY